MSNVPGIPEKLLWKSASLVGFFLLRYAAHFKAHLAQLSDLVAQGGRILLQGVILCYDFLPHAELRSLDPRVLACFPHSRVGQEGVSLAAA